MNFILTGKCLYKSSHVSTTLAEYRLNSYLLFTYVSVAIAKKSLFPSLPPNYDIFTYIYTHGFLVITSFSTAILLWTFSGLLPNVRIRQSNTKQL